MNARDWCAAKRETEQARKAWHDRMVTVAITFVISLSTFGATYHLRQKPAMIRIEGGRSTTVPDSRGDAKVWGAWVEPAKSANWKWAHAMPGYNAGEELNLVADATACAPDAIACADAATRTIYVAQSGDGIDRTTVMMHEIGHLLGVRHIDGDKLMDANYQGAALEYPTVEAVALATIKMEEKRKAYLSLPFITHEFSTPNGDRK